MYGKYFGTEEYQVLVPFRLRSGMITSISPTIEFILLLTTFSCAVNPVLYSMRSTYFRQGLKRLFHIKANTIGTVMPLEASTQQICECILIQIHREQISSTVGSNLCMNSQWLGKMVHIGNFTISIFSTECLNTLGTRLNDCYFPDGIFKRIFLKWKC